MRYLALTYTVLPGIPCITCVQNIINPPAYFDHSECVKAMDTWRDDVLEARGIGDNAPPPPKKRCSNGHTQTVEAILSNRVVHDSVVCPSCWVASPGSCSASAWQCPNTAAAATRSTETTRRGVSAGNSFLRSLTKTTRSAWYPVLCLHACPAMFVY